MIAADENLGKGQEIMGSKPSGQRRKYPSSLLQLFCIFNGSYVMVPIIFDDLGYVNIITKCSKIGRNVEFYIIRQMNKF